MKYKIIEHFVQNPELRQNQSELSKSIKTSQINVSRHIGELLKLKLLHEEKHGKSIVYSLNLKSFLIRELYQKIIDLNHDILPKWVDSKIKLLKKESLRCVEKVILFGSASKGEMHSKSDLDVLILSQKKDSKVDMDLNHVFVAGGSEEGFSVNLQVVTVKEFENNTQKNFLFSAKNDGIVLWKKSHEGR